VVVATRNQGKVNELRRLLQGVPWRLLDLDQAPNGHEVEWEEDGATYLENAAIKAKAVYAATRLATLADDSGLEIRALGGWPGLHTARWMGTGVSGNQLLIGLTERVAQLDPGSRGAIFVCAIALALPGARGEMEFFQSEGRLEGTLLYKPRGRSGFGYDPIFVPQGERHTMAEMPQEQKDGISHRGMAVRQLLAEIS
jgi:XTP/dITP diphosphohydrolase